MNTRPLIAGAATIMAAVVIVGGGVWLFADDDPGTSDSESDSAPTTVPIRIAPLTGLPTDQPERKAVVVKIDSHPSVDEFAGLQNADLVYEVLVEGGITRYLAMFESDDSSQVGPVRSLRSSDFDLVANLGDPVVVFSGADEPTTEAARSVPMIPFTPDSPGGDDAFRRDRGRAAPHNLLVSVPEVRDAVSEPGAARAPFSHAESRPAGLPVAGVEIRFSDASRVVVEWNVEREEWLRWENGRAHVDDEDRQLGTDTVLVLDTEYSTPPWDPSIPEAVSVGHGDGLLLADGTVTEVSWTRTSASRPFVLTGAVGNSIALPPGRTWVAFAPANSAAPLDGADLADLADLIDN